MIVCFISCICAFCQTLSYTCIPFESFVFHANPYYGLKLCLGICMYTYCVDKSYIYLEMKCVLMKINFSCFMFLCLCLTSCICLFYPNYLLYMYILLSHMPSCIYLCGLFVFGYVCIL